MAASPAEPVISSEISDVHDLSLDHEVEISAAGYSRIMRLINGDDSELISPRASFNSSI
jgi:hypothetical protein